MHFNLSIFYSFIQLELTSWYYLFSKEIWFFSWELLLVPKTKTNISWLTHEHFIAIWIRFFMVNHILEPLIPCLRWCWRRSWNALLLKFSNGIVALKKSASKLARGNRFSSCTITLLKRNVFEIIWKIWIPVLFICLFIFILASLGLNFL